MKRLSSALLLVGVLASPALSLTCGDVTGDSLVTASDALAVLQSAVGLPTPLRCYPALADETFIRLRTNLSCGTNPLTVFTLINTEHAMEWTSYNPYNGGYSYSEYRNHPLEIGGGYLLKNDQDCWSVYFEIPTTGLSNATSAAWDINECGSASSLFQWNIRVQGGNLWLELWEEYPCNNTTRHRLITSVGELYRR